MTVRRMYYMACDVCLEILDHSDQDSPKDARADAKAMGWIRRKVPGQTRLEDVCVKCQAEPCRYGTHAPRDCPARVYALGGTTPEWLADHVIRPAQSRGGSDG